MYAEGRAKSVVWGTMTFNLTITASTDISLCRESPALLF
jgi:hypothetical protein